MRRGSTLPSSDSGFGRDLDRRQLLGVLGAGAIASAALPMVGCSSPAQAETLTVGGLAVTCNLTLPVACAANEVANKGGKAAFAFYRCRGEGVR